MNVALNTSIFIIFVTRSSWSALGRDSMNLSSQSDLDFHVSSSKINKSTSLPLKPCSSDLRDRDKI